MSISFSFIIKTNWAIFETVAVHIYVNEVYVVSGKD